MNFYLVHLSERGDEKSKFHREKSSRDIVDVFKENATTNQTTNTGTSSKIGKRLSPCKEHEDGDNEEDRGIEQQSPYRHRSPIEETIDDAEVTIGGRLASFLSHWKRITSDPVILQSIAAYRLPLRQRPSSQVSEPSVYLSKVEEQIYVRKKLPDFQ